MIERFTVSPAEIVVFVEDLQAENQAPRLSFDRRISATEDCIAFSLNPEPDAPTDFEIGPTHELTPDPGLLHIFNGVIQTRNKTISAYTTDSGIFTYPAPGRYTRFNIWSDDLEYPSKFVIGMSAESAAPSSTESQGIR